MKNLVNIVNILALRPFRIVPYLDTVQSMCASILVPYRNSETIRLRSWLRYGYAHRPVAKAIFLRYGVHLLEVADEQIFLAFIEGQVQDQNCARDVVSLGVSHSLGEYSHKHKAHDQKEPGEGQVHP